MAHGPIIHFPRMRPPKKFATCLPEEKEDTKQSIRDIRGEKKKESQTHFAVLLQLLILSLQGLSFKWAVGSWLVRVGLQTDFRIIFADNVSTPHKGEHYHNFHNLGCRGQIYSCFSEQKKNYHRPC